MRFYTSIDKFYSKDEVINIGFDIKIHYALII
jgi:hypothetical protein